MRSAETFSIFYEEIGGKKSWNGNLAKEYDYQGSVYVFHFFPHLSAKYPPLDVVLGPDIVLAWVLLIQDVPRGLKLQKKTKNTGF